MKTLDLSPGWRVYGLLMSELEISDAAREPDAMRKETEHEP
jgi:hypothetical protein